MDIPDVDELPTMEELIETDGVFAPEVIAQRALANLPEMLDKQERLVQIFKTTKAEELKDALKDCSKAFR